MFNSTLTRSAVITGSLAWLVATALGPNPARAGEPAPGPAAPVQSLDEQVQEIKSDVLGIAAELGNLEEKLLYPSDTQLAVFVSLAKGEPLEVDSARIRLDGKLVAEHIYGAKELEALARGGVQRIHTANVSTGSHQIEVTIAGRRGSQKPFDLVERYDFSKDVGPKMIGVRLAGGASDDDTVSIEAW